ncbi:MAG: 16S rRNA (uracil(1498)-N(3))-methyltransferase [Thermodesulfovibrionales bacterium]|nr:16S rRNA (uracil(1498)-N(3))-methyltransferase [Thermodesulfovibrionales bacterium]
MRIIIPKKEIQKDKITISGEKARYLISVLRCSAGDELQVFDGEGSLYKYKITGIENKKVIIALLEQISLNAESPLNLTLVQGILKGEKMDMVIQKATELGVKEIIPAVTERSQIRHTRKVDRWRKIAEEASRQSGRTMIPVVHEPMEFSNFFEGYCNPPVPPLEKGGKGGFESLVNSHKIKGFIFWEEGGLPLKEAIEKMQDTRYKMQDTRENLSNHPESCIMNPASLYLLIGPEGGFSKEEVSLAVSKGLITVSLGKRILRAETAAISAVALIQFLLGDI